VLIWIADQAGYELMGEIPTGAQISVLPRADAPPPGDPAEVAFWVPPLETTADTVALAKRMTGLKVVQLLSAGADAWIGHLPPTVTLCDGKGVHTPSVAEWVVGAILVSLHRFDYLARAQTGHRSAHAEVGLTEELMGKRVLIVGAGSIGEATAARLAPFGVEITYAARTARNGVHGVDELPRLLPRADIVVLLVPLTPQTRGLVNAEFLAAMPNGALLVNAARGPVADTAALTKEFSSGRINGALDVSDPEPLPADHPLWDLPNVVITPHVAGATQGVLGRGYRLVGEQVRRFASGETLANRVHDGY
jgi:phosphoglycerate dehydrogenase-like enzyme